MEPPDFRCMQQPVFKHHRGGRFGDRYAPRQLETQAGRSAGQATGAAENLLVVCADEHGEARASRPRTTLPGGGAARSSVGSRAPSSRITPPPQPERQRAQVREQQMATVSTVSTGHLSGTAG